MSASVSTRRRIPLQRIVLLAPVAVLFLVFFAWPILEVVVRSLSATGKADWFASGISFANYATIFHDELLRLIEWRTILLAVNSTLLALLLGFPTAYFISRLRRRSAGLVLLLVLIPFWVSIVVRLFSVTSLLSPNGLVSETAQLFGAEQFSLLYTQAGTLIGTTMYLLPYMILILYAGMSAVDSNLMLAARTMGASGRKAFTRVFLPLVRPSVLSGSLLCFILALGFFIVPAILGGPRDQTVSVYIQQQIDLFKWGVASALGVVLLVVTLVFYALVIRFAGGFQAGGIGSTQAKGVAADQPFRWSPGLVVSAVALVITLALLLVPVALVFPLSIGETGTVVFPPRGFTLDWYAAVFTGTTWLGPLLQSFTVAVLTGLLSVAVALILARWVQTMRSRTLRAVVTGLAFAPLITPSILLAIGIYDVQLILDLTGTIGGLVLAHTVVAFPLAFALISTALSSSGNSLEPAAWTLGASRNRAFWLVTVRAILPSILGAFGLAFVTSWDKVVLALFLQTGPTKTLPVTIYQYLESGIVPTVPAVASLLIIAVLVIVALRPLASRLSRLTTRQTRTRSE